MVVEDREIERIAAELIAKYGARAARVATERLNRMIDRNNISGRDIWARVVHAIHECQGSDSVDPDPGRETRERRTTAESH